MAKSVFRPNETKLEGEKVLLPLVHNFAPVEEETPVIQEVFDLIPAMKMHPSHRPCLFALAALPARSRTIDLRGNVTHTGNLGSVPKVPILKYRIILRGRANIMRIACAVAGSVPRFLIGARGREHIQR